METDQAIDRKESEPQPAGKLYLENTLLRISGALFCHDQKRAAMRTQEIALNREGTAKTIVIRPDPTIGQPGPLAHKIFIALLKKHSDYGRPAPHEISFTRREIGRLIGRKDWGGRDSEQLSRALHEIHYTFVKTQFKSRGGRYAEHSFNVFPEILIERREVASDPIETCTVTLAEPIIKSLQDEHFTCLNHALMMQLGTIGQAIYMRLFFHFANLYDGRSGKRLAFPKRYDDICAEWLGGLTVHAHPSKIVTEQLGVHLDQLVQVKFLSFWSIERAKGRQGFVLTFRPGSVFFEDYNRFYQRRHQGQLRQRFEVDRRGIGEPLKVAHLFAEKRTGVATRSIAFVSSKDVETAKQILGTINFADIPAFLDYALAEANRTNFNVQTIGGVKQYLPAYLSRKEKLAADRIQYAARQARERDEARREAYDRYRRSQAVHILTTLPQAEREIIEGQARTYADSFAQPLGSRMLEFGKARFTLERYGDQIATFEQWSTDPAGS